MKLEIAAPARPTGALKNSSFLKSFTSSAKPEHSGIAALGFLESQKLSLNELAARGVNISVRDTLGIKVKDVGMAATGAGAAADGKGEEDEEDGLEFVSGAGAGASAERKSPEDDKPTMLLINGQKVVKQKQEATAAASRTDFLQSLRTRNLEKKQGLIDLAQLQQTFQTTDLNSKAKARQHGTLAAEHDDPLLAQEQEDAEDSEFEVEETP